MSGGKDIAYISGFIDGEGYIGLTKATKQNLRPLIFIDNTNKEVLCWIKKKLGLSNNVTLHKRGKGKRRLCYCLHITGINTVKRVLELLLPYLIIKKAQAKTILIYCSEHIKGNGPTDKEREIYTNMAKLNKRGEDNY